MSGAVEELPQRVASKFCVNEHGCWIWKHGQNGFGYGLVRWNGGMQAAHRVIYELLVGPIPKGHHLHHQETCPKTCVNPSHLTPITPSEHGRLHPNNNQAWRDKMLLRTHCKHGHELTPDNVYTRPGRNNRDCRICRRELGTVTQRSYRTRKRAV